MSSNQYSMDRPAPTWNGIGWLAKSGGVTIQIDDSDKRFLNAKITLGGNMQTFSSGIDNYGILNGLDSFRNERDRSTRMGELLNDEAALLELEAAHKRAQAALIYKQLNEDVPVPVDVAQGPFDFTDKGKKASK